MEDACVWIPEIARIRDFFFQNAYLWRTVRWSKLQPKWKYRGCADEPFIALPDVKRFLRSQERQVFSKEGLREGVADRG